MTTDGPLARALAFFVAPAEAPPARAATTIPPAARAVVVGAAPDAIATAAGIALALRAADGSPAALTAVWRGEPPAPALATRAAARLAARVAVADLPATARGRLAWLSLPDDALAAAAAVRRASARVAGPFVTALAGPRPLELELLIAEHDIAIVVADPATPLARAALTALEARGIDAAAIPPLGRGLARTLALAGLAGPGLARLVATEIVEGAK